MDAWFVRRVTLGKEMTLCALCGEVFADESPEEHTTRVHPDEATIQAQTNAINERLLQDTHDPVEWLKRRVVEIEQGVTRCPLCEMERLLDGWDQGLGTMTGPRRTLKDLSRCDETPEEHWARAHPDPADTKARMAQLNERCRTHPAFEKQREFLGALFEG